MQGRRSHPRFVLSGAHQGSLRVLSDVVVQSAGAAGLLAISPEPAVASERLMLELAGAGAAATLDVEVTESRPVIVEGAVRHRLELQVRDVVTHEIPGARRATAG